MLSVSVKSLEVQVFSRDWVLQRSYDSVTGVWEAITWVKNALEVVCVVLMVAGTGTTSGSRVSALTRSSAIS